MLSYYREKKKDENKRMITYDGEMESGEERNGVDDGEL